MARKRTTIDRREFRGNYTWAFRTELDAVIEAYRMKRLKKDDLRAFAGRLEAKALHEKSSVDIHRIVNANKQGGPAMSQGNIDRSLERIDEVLAEVPQRGRKAIVARLVAKHIAHGKATCSEVMVLLYYSLNRIKQNKRLKCLAPNERYARIRYRALSELSGCQCATLCRAVARLRRDGFLQVLVVQKQNENRYGGLFVDGPVISLTPQNRQSCSSCVKPTTPSAISDNASPRFPTTLINKNPKKRILKRKGTGFRLQEKDGVLVASRMESIWKTDPELLRIQARAHQMEGMLLDAVA